MGMTMLSSVLCRTYAAASSIRSSYLRRRALPRFCCPCFCCERKAYSAASARSRDDCADASPSSRFTFASSQEE